MIRSLYTSVSGLITQEAKQDVVTNNLANINTVGFKGDSLLTKRFNDVLLQNYDKKVNGKNVRNELGTLSEGSLIDGTSTDFTGGMIQETGKATDFAIEGRGFFVVRRNDTVTGTKDYYTRDGHFHVNAKGTLVNDNGDAVMAKEVAADGRTGTAGPIEGITDKVEAGSYGIKIGNKDYRLETVNPANYDSLKKYGDNLYSYEGQQLQDDDNVVVKQNSLEKSNVNTINEITNMMTVMRSFESNQKVVQALDETLGKAVNEVGSVR